MIDDSRFFVIGANGQLGTALRKKYPKAQFADKTELDITDRQSVESFDWSGISTILNTAAFTNVDGAETPEGRVAAWKVNASAVANLTRICRAHDITLVHISSDYVFDGTREPHFESEDLSPLSVYGASKAAGESAATAWRKHYLLRTSWVVGEGKNFVATMASLAERGVDPAVVADQWGRPTFTQDLAGAALHLLFTGAPYGTYHVSNSGEVITWADLARAVYTGTGHDAARVSNTTTEEYFANAQVFAPRPANSALDLSKLIAAGFTPRDHRDALAEYLHQLGGARED